MFIKRAKLELLSLTAWSMVKKIKKAEAPVTQLHNCEQNEEEQVRNSHKNHITHQQE